MFKFCLSGQITNLELEVCTIKTQLEENLHHSIKNTSKGELNRDVEYELDCLSGIGRSFGKKHQYVCIFMFNTILGLLHYMSQCLINKSPINNFYIGA